MDLNGFREYLETCNGKWTPDTGPIIRGIGVAATGLGLKAAFTVGDVEIHKELRRSVDLALGLLRTTEKVSGINIITAIGTDVLASAIYSNSLVD